MACVALLPKDLTTLKVFCLSGTSVVYTDQDSLTAGENSFTITDCDGNTLAEMTYNWWLLVACNDALSYQNITDINLSMH